MKSALVALSHKNSVRTLRKCLESLQAQDYPDFKVVITDAGSTDGSIEIAQSFAENDPRFVFKLLDGCNEGQGEDWAIKNFPSDVILFTNSDIYVPPHWVSLHVAWHENGFDMVGGHQVYAGDKYDFAWSSYRPSRCYSELTQGMSLGFTNCSTTAAFYEKVGGVDTTLWYGTDMDFFLRGIKAHAKIALDPKLEVVHDHPLNTFYWCFRKAFKYGLIQVTLLRLHYKSRWRWPGYPRWVSANYLLPGSDVRAGIKTWKQQRLSLMATTGRDGRTLIAWLFNRYWAVGIAYRLGALVAMILPPSFDGLRAKRITYGKR